METEDGRWAGRTCLVLGGGGFMGSWLVDALVRRGAEVRAYGRISQFAPRREDVTWLVNDFADRVALARAIEGAEVVFHLLGAGTPESSNADPYANLLAGPGATLQLLNLCRSEGVRRFVFASSGGTVYGIPQSTPIPESAPTHPISAYGVAKLTIEKYLHLLGHLHGFDYAVMRISNPFGPRQSPFRRQGLIAAILYKLLRGAPVEIWGDGSVVRDFLYVGDLVEAFVRVAEYGGPVRVFNIGSGQGLSVNEVVHGAAAAIGCADPRIVYKPGRQVDAPANVLDVSLAARELGWRVETPWAEGVRTTADWMRGLTGRASPKRGREGDLAK
ncbi:MAG: NAD-dependent epimerase/dehydratase family protein [Caulobacteraceae bacterium]|nr:NAD-dependent epimerase/dehydratase family protein [Caulobacteraceae bacterium]